MSTIDRLLLPKVELIAIRGGGEPSEYFLKALQISMSGVCFGKVTFLTNEDVSAIEGVDIVKIAALGGRIAYSEFCVHELGKYVSLPFSLNIQTDGFVVTPYLWTDEFLKYDYIGAPWATAIVCNEDRVGNGGFSLRSRKFLNECLRLPYQVDDCEDHFLCRKHRPYLISRGIEFAPVELAACFSREERYGGDDYSLDLAFGFHGWARGREAYKFMIYGCSQ